MKVYKTPEQEHDERAFIATQSVKLFRELHTIVLYPLHHNPKFKQRVYKESAALEKILANREIERWCYYCHRTKTQTELGDDTYAQLTACLDCTIEAQNWRYSLSS